MNDITTKPVGLPKHVVEAVGNEVFDYGGTLSSLSEEKILKVTDFLFVYYPPTDEEKKSALALREWLTIRQVVQEGSAVINRFSDLVTSGVRAWAQLVERTWREREDRYRYREERHREYRHSEIPELLT